MCAIFIDHFSGISMKKRHFLENWISKQSDCPWWWLLIFLNLIRLLNWVLSRCATRTRREWINPKSAIMFFSRASPLCVAHRASLSSAIIHSACKIPRSRLHMGSARGLCATLGVRKGIVFFLLRVFLHCSVFALCFHAETISDVTLNPYLKEYNS